MNIITNSQIGYNGRLGNQLFQFASLYGISKKSGKGMAIPIENTVPRPQQLADGSVVSAKFDVPEVFKRVGEYLETVNSFAKGRNFININEGSFLFDQGVINDCRRDDVSINLNGYFQSPLYFYEYRDELLDIFKFNDKPERNWEKPMVSIHVRRGDYLALGDNHPACTMAYYSEAVDQFYGCNFLVFSDDIQWCKRIFPKEFEFSENTNEEDDLRDMSLCDHHIIANSTFSWWGAYLNKSKDKRIIAPKNWFGPNYSGYDTSEITSIATQLL